MQKKKSLKNLFLVLICAHDGEYTWHQLERELEWRGLAGNFRATDITDILQKESLITQVIKSDRSPALPVYKVTDIGKEKAKECVEKSGLDDFKITRQNPEDYEF